MADYSFHDAAVVLAVLMPQPTDLEGIIAGFDWTERAILTEAEMRSVGLILLERGLIQVNGGKLEATTKGLELRTNERMSWEEIAALAEPISEMPIVNSDAEWPFGQSDYRRALRRYGFLGWLIPLGLGVVAVGIIGTLIWIGTRSLR